MKIDRDIDEIIIRLPAKAQRFNPLKDESSEMENICGVIDGDDCGFAEFIDMSYKGKSDQLTKIIVHVDLPEVKFRELCKEMEIEVYKYPVCKRCGATIYGCFEWDKGYLCQNCYDRKKKKVFICSPYRGDVETNTKNAKKYARDVIEEGAIPIVPHLYFTQFLDDNNERDRKIGIMLGIELLKECDSVNVYGTPTEGMKKEIDEAIRMKKDVKTMKT